MFHVGAFLRRSEGGRVGRDMHVAVVMSIALPHYVWYNISDGAKFIYGFFFAAQQ